MKTFLAKIWRACNIASKLQLRLMRVMNDEFLIGVTGIIFNEKDEILLVKHTYRQVPWSLPGGYLKAKEHPTEGLEREVKEETGLIISADRQLKLRTDRTTGRLDIMYMGTLIGGDFKPSEEVTEYGLFSFDTLPIILEDQVIFIDYALKQRKKLKKEKLLPSANGTKKETIFNKFGRFFAAK
jgi:8-oxo-dGTP diphosphatase